MDARRICLAALAAFALGQGACAEPMSAQECQALDARLRNLTRDGARMLRSMPTLAPAASGCGAGEVSSREEVTPRIGYAIGGVRVDGDGLSAFALTGAPPTRLTVDVKHFRVLPISGSPALDFAFAAQSIRGGVDLRLAVSRDPETARLTLEELSADFPGENAATMTAEAIGVDLSTPEALAASAETAKLTRLRFEVETRGLFESYALIPLAQSVLSDAEDPEAAFEAWKAEVARSFDAIPAENLPEASRQAVRRVIDDLPNPNGRIVLDLVYPEGYGLEEAMALGKARLESPDVWIAAPMTAEIEYHRDDLEAAH